MLVRPNFDSWLVKGGIVLTAFGGLAALWLLFEYMGWETHPVILWAVIPVGGLTAGYTAFLFHQAKGRDFWQSRGLLVHLLLEAVVCGAAGLILLDAVGFYNEPGLVLEVILGISALLQWLVIRHDIDPKHENVDFRNAAKEILSGRFSRSFLWCVSGCGTLLPLVLLGTVFFVKGAPGWLPIIASVLVLCGALEYGRIWIRAGQSGKLS
jgi:formate-dependent nitrite reductase membrane component NrfD